MFAISERPPGAPECSTAELLAGLDAAYRRTGRDHRELLAYLAACDDAKVWRDDDCRSMGHWVAINYGVPSLRATRMVHAGHALRDLPLLADALCDGELSVDKVLELCRFATPDDERALIRWAKKVSVAAIRDRADLAARIDSDELADSHRARRLDWWWGPDKMLSLYGLLPADQGAIVAKALDRLAAKVPDTPEDDSDPESNRSAKRADALALLASQAIAADPDPERATVVVHVPVRTLSHGDANGAIESGPVIAPEVARGLCCDSRMQFVFENEVGAVVGVGRAARELPPHMARALRHRDGNRCRFPGCGNRAFLKIHHIDWWVSGGHTDLDKLLLVCPAHHDLIHKIGWRVALKNGIEACWFRPDGSVFVPGPSP